MAERAQKLSLFDPAIVRRAMRDSVIKLHPRTLMRNPVMFVVEVVAAVTTILFIRDLFGGTESPGLRRADRRLVVVYRPLRQLCGGRGRRTRQGPGGCPTAYQDADHGQAAERSRES